MEYCNEERDETAAEKEAEDVLVLEGGVVFCVFTILVDLFGDETEFGAG